jgi:transcriptional regulator with XRE-family HTH domain
MIPINCIQTKSEVSIYSHNVLQTPQKPHLQVTFVWIIQSGSIMTIVGERIKQLRTQAGMTQGDLAGKVGLTYVQIGRYEKRGAVPSADVLSKLAEALNTTTDFLMHGSTQDKANAQLNDNELLTLFRSVEKMNPEDKSIIKTVIDALVTKRQIQQLAS